uniref:Uncharacterized protein n=1 Tax=Escherichia coli TaxID=562 RepID=A0A7U1E214_ECOLX|nr:hypothetical protein [Escherichia coli]
MLKVLTDRGGPCSAPFTCLNISHNSDRLCHCQSPGRSVDHADSKDGGSKYLMIRQKTGVEIIFYDILN